MYAQIIRNVVINTLTHAFEPDEQGTIVIEVQQQTDSIFIHYRDNGKGMTEETLSKVFEPFYTTKRDRGNTGLRLHIV
ncbi:hypothetical protein CSA56_12270 [candidate division KSB3 bacterium]|uniref:histidine kinase n=1 Tax=candidate division KSB3 bacterium TaxID=2044937 RepID=A0A2G6KEV6_9BACT|nr:MAG: hypothetical protein CSA56_12270 [candidate division KSB3 bacterium]